MVIPEKCPLCPEQNWSAQLQGDVIVGNCPTCGLVSITPEALDEIGKYVERTGPSSDGLRGELHRLSALTKAAVPGSFTINAEHVAQLERGEIRERSVLEKVDLLLAWLNRKSKYAGEWIDTEAGYDYPSAACRSWAEWLQLLDMIADQLGLINVDRSGNYVTGVVARITLKGWEWLETKPKASGRIAFIAMAFTPELAGLNQAIQLGVLNAGYQPVRLDEDHYSGGVMDKVIATIRSSRFVVVDFTHNRGGVYYEAGFAAGLGIPIVHLCHTRCMKPDSPDRIHFDVQHVNFLLWEESTLNQLPERLTDRIVALFGRGPFKPELPPGSTRTGPRLV